MTHEGAYIDYDKFYTKKEFEQILESNGLIKCTDKSIHSFRDTLNKYNTELADSIFVKLSYHKLLIFKDFVDRLDWEFIKILKSTNVQNYWQAIIENHFEGYVLAYTATIILGYNRKNSRAIERVMEEDNGIFTTIKVNGVRKTKTEDVIRWLEFKNSVITLGEIYTSVVDEMGEENKGSGTFHLQNKRKLIESGLFDKYNTIRQNDTPFRTKNPNELYINIKYKDEIYEQIKHQLSDKMVEVFGSKKKINSIID